MNNELPAEIAAIHNRLNRYDLMPAGIYRRDKFLYDILSLVNNLAGCLASESYNATPVLLLRAARELERLRHGPKLNNDELAYLELTEHYCRAVGCFVFSQPQPSEFIDGIPTDWKLPNSPASNTE